MAGRSRKRTYNEERTWNKERKELLALFPGLLDAKGPASEEYKIILRVNRKNMTWAMQFAEAQLGKSLEKVLSRERRGSDIARELGISQSSVVRWREKLGI